MTQSCTLWQLDNLIETLNSMQISYDTVKVKRPTINNSSSHTRDKWRVTWASVNINVTLTAVISLSIQGGSKHSVSKPEIKPEPGSFYRLNEEKYF